MNILLGSEKSPLSLIKLIEVEGMEAQKKKERLIDEASQLTKIFSTIVEKTK